MPVSDKTPFAAWLSAVKQIEPTMLETDLKENGKQVRLEVVLHKPEG
jgi:hypothetical protein